MYLFHIFLLDHDFFFSGKAFVSSPFRFPIQKCFWSDLFYLPTDFLNVC